MQMFVQRIRILPGNLSEKIALEKDFQKQGAIFSDYYIRVKAQQLPRENSSAEIEKFIRRKMYETAGNISIAELAKQSGYSACYIRRCFETVHGISSESIQESLSVFKECCIPSVKMPIRHRWKRWQQIAAIMISRI